MEDSRNHPADQKRYRAAVRLLMRVIRRATLGMTLLITLVAICAASDTNKYRLRRIASDPAGGGDAAISPDGRRMVISSQRMGSWDLWVFDLHTKRWSRLTAGEGDNFEAQWSPDSQRLAFTSTRKGNKDIWILRLGDGKLTQITDSPDDDEYPSWSPDGRMLVYTGGPWKQRDFFIVASEGGAPRRLTRQPGLAGACSFMPDGREVICHSYDSGSGNISILSLDGGQQVPVTQGSAWDYKPAVSSREGWVAFSRSTDGPSSIWVKRLAGGGARPLTSTRYSDRWPTWTAAGDRLLFHRLIDEGSSIKMLDRRSGKVKTLVGADERPQQASLDPAARLLVYSAEIQGHQWLRLRRLSDHSTRTLDTGPGDAASPRWSPDGKQIAFACKSGKRWEVCTIAADGQNLRTWTTALEELHGMDGALDWSPDSAKLVFKAEAKPFESDLYILDLHSGEIRNLTNDEWFDEAPSWTPNGKALLFMSTRGGDWTWGLFRLSLEDGKVEAVVTPDYTEKNYVRSARDGAMAWSMYDSRGIGHVIEQTPDGKRRVVTGLGLGTRWPSYSADGRYLIGTTTERRVEYWIGENLFSSGSPLLADAKQAEDTEGILSLNQGANANLSRLHLPAMVQTSPRQMYHR